MICESDESGKGICVERFLPKRVSGVHLYPHMPVSHLSRLVCFKKKQWKNLKNAAKHLQIKAETAHRIPEPPMIQRYSVSKYQEDLRHLLKHSILRPLKTQEVSITFKSFLDRIQLRVCHGFLYKKSAGLQVMDNDFLNGTKNVRSS